MTEQLNEALKRLVTDTSAGAATVRNRSAGAIVLGSYPSAAPPAGCAVPAGTSRTIDLDEDLELTVLWCDPGAVGDLDDKRNRPAIEAVRSVARLSRDLMYASAEMEGLRAAVDGLQDSVATLSPRSGIAAINISAAALLGIPQGKNPLTLFEQAVDRLAARVINRTEVNHWRGILVADPSAAIECMWRFPTEPTHLWVVSRPVSHQGFHGRNWVFSDESETGQALESLERAHAQLRASADGMLDPQALLQGVRDAGGRIVDFVYRDVNRATCEYLGMAREELIGRTLLETMPNLKPSGLLDLYAECAVSHRPMIIDDAVYDNEILAKPLHYDIRGNHVGGDYITLTWRDVTERVEAAQRIANSEARFRLLAENVGDVVMHVRDGVIVWVSPSVADALGAPESFWVGRRIEDIIAEEDRNAHDKVTWLAADRAVIPRGRLKGADGSTHWVHVHAKGFHDAKGKADGYTASFRVIDDEMRAIERAELALRQQAESDAKYRRLMDSAAIGMCLVRPDGHFDAVNQAACDFFGYDAETLKTMTWQEMTTADTLERDLRNVEDMLAGRIDRYRVTTQYVHADGHPIWADQSVSCLRDAEGDVEFFVSQLIDITAEVEIRRKIAQRDQQNRALTQRLQAQTDRLQSELKIAEAYVRSLLPNHLEGPVRVSHSYLPSRELGGDSFDYRWIDNEHLMIYLIDVSGHGIAPALESISVHNLLRSGALPLGVLLEPARVLAELNAKFPMDEHGGNYFTMWYGVYHPPTGTLRYASAGHPPALAFAPGARTPDLLSGMGFPVGMFPDTEFGSRTFPVAPGTEVIIYSDGAFELPVPEGARWTLTDFIDLCSAVSAESAESGDSEWSTDELAAKLKQRTVAGLFGDDCSLVRLRF